MKIMRDACPPSSRIPADTPIVAGYGDGICQWSSADWDRFPNAIQLVIVCFPGSSGDILDIEPGCASPSDAPGWIARYNRPIFKVPSLYVNRSNRDAVVAACTGLTYDLWVATLDGTIDVPGFGTTVGAIQYIDVGGIYDESVCADFWPRVPIAPVPKLLEEDMIHFEHIEPDTCPLDVGNGFDTGSERVTIAVRDRGNNVNVTGRVVRVSLAGTPIDAHDFTLTSRGGGDAWNVPNDGTICGFVLQNVSAPVSLTVKGVRL